MSVCDKDRRGTVGDENDLLDMTLRRVEKNHRFGLIFLNLASTFCLPAAPILWVKGDGL